jgi:pimeloyl-ACP methyl ester carboxylesterase
VKRNLPLARNYRAYLHFPPSRPRRSTSDCGTSTSTARHPSTNDSSRGAKTSSSATSSTFRRPGNCPDDVVKYYVDELASNPDSLRGSFEFYRAFDAPSAQNELRKTRPLTIPVLAIGGEKSSGDGVGNTMRLVAQEVQTVVLPGSGHWVAEEAPNDLLAAYDALPRSPYRAGRSDKVAAGSDTGHPTGKTGQCPGFQTVSSVLFRKWMLI